MAHISPCLCNMAAYLHIYVWRFTSSFPLFYCFPKEISTVSYQYHRRVLNWWTILNNITLWAAHLNTIDIQSKDRSKGSSYYIDCCSQAIYLRQTYQLRIWNAHFSWKDYSTQAIAKIESIQIKNVSSIVKFFTLSSASKCRSLMTSSEVIRNTLRTPRDNQIWLYHPAF